MKVLLPILFLLPLFTSCQWFASWTESSITEENEQRLELLEEEIARQDKAIDTWTERAKDAVASLNVSKMNEAEANLRMALSAKVNAAREATEILSQAREGKLSPFMNLLAGIPSPIQPLIPLFGSIVAVLSGKRSRRFAWVTVRDSLKVGVLETIRNVKRTVGAEHSSDDSEAAAIADPTSPIRA